MAEIEELRRREKQAIGYVRAKTDQLLEVMGTLPLRPEELDDATLFSLDPIGIVSDAFSQVLDHLRRTNEELALARDEIQAIFDSAGAAILVVDSRMRLQAFNRRSQELFFPGREDVLGRNFREVVCDPDQVPEDCIFDRVMATRWAVELTDFVSGGRHFHVSGSPIKDRDGVITHVVLVYADITARRCAEEALRESEARYRDLFENANDLIQSISPEGSILYANRAWREALGYAPEEVAGLSLRDIIHPDCLDKCLESFQKVLAGERIDRLEATFLTRDGRAIAVEGSVNCNFVDGRPAATRGIFRDITERKRAEQEIHRLAYFDTLTDLPNRTLLHDRLRQALAQAERGGKLMAVMFLDIDRFKGINDNLGHAVGDQLLKAIAARLSACVRRSDTIARVGGDEFVIILSGIGSRQDVAVTAEKILQALAVPVVMEEREVVGTGSLGIALYPHDGADVDALLKNADAAMYRAKELGRNTFQFYAAAMSAQGLDRRRLGDGPDKASS